MNIKERLQTLTSSIRSRLDRTHYLHSLPQDVAERIESEWKLNEEFAHMVTAKGTHYIPPWSTLLSISRDAKWENFQHWRLDIPEVNLNGYKLSVQIRGYHPLSVFDINLAIPELGKVIAMAPRGNRTNPLSVDDLLFGRDVVKAVQRSLNIVDSTTPLDNTKTLEVR